jgi:ATP-dependent protease HslVU (ClpYQ) peptidase subunit
MTTIVFDGKTLAVDSQQTAGTTIIGMRNKIRDVGGFYVAGCGRTDCIDSVINHFINGSEKPSGISAEDADVLFVNKETGEAFRVFGDMMTMSNASIPFFSGSGEDVARGAYHACGDIIKALKVAIDLDAYTGGQINMVEIQKPA